MKYAAQPDRPTIYVPAYYGVEAGREEPAVPGCMMVISHEDIYGWKASFEELERVLSSLPAEGLLIAIAKLNALLFWHSYTNPAVQRGLVAELVDSPVKEQVLRSLRAPNQIALFEEQLLGLAKEAVLFGKQSGDLDLTESWNEVIRAAFLTSELLTGEHPVGGDFESDFTPMVVRSLYFNRFEAPSNLLARYSDLLVSRPYKQGHRESPNWVDTKALFRAATGLDLEDYLAAGFALVAHFGRFRNARDLEEYPFQVAWDDLKVTLPDPQASERFIKNVARPVTELSSEFRSMASKSQLAGASLLPFFKTPVVLLKSGNLVPVSLSMLVDKLTNGVYWTLHEHMRKQGSQSLLRFTAFVGELFQAQVFDLLDHSYQESTLLAKRLFGDISYGRPELRGADATLFYDDTVIFFEVVSSRLRYRDTVLLGDLVALDQDIDKCIVDKARQLDRVIRDFRAGRLVLNEIDSARITHAIPVIVLLEPFPLFPLTWRRINRRLHEEGYLSNSQPLRVISAEELERVEPLLETGHTFRSLLVGWTKDVEYSELSLKNFLLARFPTAPFRGSQMENLYDKFRQLVNERLTLEGEARPSIDPS